MTTTTTTANAQDEVCDSCLNIAHDEGAQGIDIQVFLMQELGAELPDHFCDARDEPDIFPKGCACACYRQRSGQQ